jgi:hypothetical protein
MAAELPFLNPAPSPALSLSWRLTLREPHTSLQNTSSQHRGMMAKRRYLTADVTYQKRRWKAVQIRHSRPIRRPAPALAQQMQPKQLPGPLQQPTCPAGPKQDLQQLSPAIPRHPPNLYYHARRMTSSPSCSQIDCSATAQTASTCSAAASPSVPRGLLALLGEGCAGGTTGV